MEGYGRRATARVAPTRYDASSVASWGLGFTLLLFRSGGAKLLWYRIANQVSQDVCSYEGSFLFRSCSAPG
jgi:hypothetical protein